MSDDHHDDHFYDNYCHPYLSPHVVLKQHEEQLCKEAGLDYGLYAQWYMYCSAQQNPKDKHASYTSPPQHRPPQLERPRRRFVRS